MASKSATKRRAQRKAVAVKEPHPLAKHVRILNAALDEDKSGDIILRGRIDPATLEAIQVDDYQREILPISTLEQIKLGFKEGGSVPDIDLGMRGARTKDDGETYVLLSDVYVVDGLQRVQAAIQFRDSEGLPFTSTPPKPGKLNGSVY
jgi:hypothetical protein